MKDAKPNIFLVDDNQINLRVLSGILSNQGYDVRPATSGEMALSAIQVRLPDLILLDIRMPGMSGYELCERLKADEDTRAIPVIFISALDEVVDKVKGFSLGAVDYITKPFQEEEVLARVEMHLKLQTLQKDLQKRNVQLQTDIVERKRAEKALGESERRLRDIAFSMADWIWEVDENGVYTYCSEKIKDILGYAREEIIGKTPFDLMPKKEAERIGDIFNSIVSEKKPIIDLENWNLTKKGRKVCLQTSGVPIYGDKGEFLGYRGVDKDITERKHAEEELIKYYDHLEDLVIERTGELEKKALELEEANLRLQEADRLKSVFLASVSHELRTPLNSIIGFTGIILQGMAGEINEEQKNQLFMVKNSADHLLRLVQAVLDIADIEAGRAEPSVEEFEFDALANEVLESFSPAAKEKGLELITDVPKRITLASDRERIKNVLMNFVSNAEKFTDRGSVTIKASVSGDDNLEMSVIDTGIGIREEDMGKLFQPFQQVDMSHGKRHEGTGLGLHLTKKLAVLLGGDVAAKSEYGKGSEFTFILQLNHSEQKHELS